MYFKIEKGSEIFNKLSALQKKVLKVRKAAKDATNKVGGKGHCIEQGVLAGGISAVEFDNKPDGWKSVGDKWQDLYYPKASNKKDLEIFNSLPTIEYDELNNIVGFEAPQTITVGTGLGFAWVNTVGVKFGKEYHLIEVMTGTKYNPPAGVVEILESEYFKLESNPINLWTIKQ